jgi:hypothetical protein
VSKEFLGRLIEFIHADWSRLKLDLNPVLDSRGCCLKTLFNLWGLRFVGQEDDDGLGVPVDPMQAVDVVVFGDHRIQASSVA